MGGHMGPAASNSSSLHLWPCPMADWRHRRRYQRQQGQLACRFFSTSWAGNGQYLLPKARAIVLSRRLGNLGCGYPIPAW